MKNHEGCRRAFHQVSRAWYANTALTEFGIVDRFNVGMYAPDGGTSGDFEVSFEKLCGNVLPRLCAFGDSWNALFTMGDLLESMADIDNENVSPDEFRKLLIALGFEDITATTET